MKYLSDNMKEPLGDKIFNISIIVTGVIWAGGWLLLLACPLLQWLFPSKEFEIKDFIDKISKPLMKVFEYSFYIAAVLLLIKLLAGMLGWGDPVDTILDKGDSHDGPY